MNISSVGPQADPLSPTTTKSSAQSKIQDINPLIKGLVITGKVLFIATLIAGFVAICIFVPPLATTIGSSYLLIVILAGWGAIGVTLNASRELISYSCDDLTTSTYNDGDIFRYTHHNFGDCIYFLINSIALPILGILDITRCFTCCDSPIEIPD